MGPEEQSSVKAYPRMDVDGSRLYSGVQQLILGTAAAPQDKKNEQA